MLHRALFEFVGIETDDDLNAALELVAEAGCEACQFTLATETYDTLLDLQGALVVLDEYMPAGKVLIAHRTRPRELH